MADNKSLLIWGIVILLVVLFATGTINLGSKEPAKTTPTSPSSLQCTYTIYTKDGLATTNSPINVSYFLFDKTSGKLMNSGATSGAASSAALTLDWNTNYHLLVYQDNGDGTGYHPVEDDVSCGGSTAPAETLSLDKFSSAQIIKMRDPTDFDSNISVGAGLTVDFDVIYKANETNAMLKSPIVVIEVNRTSVDKVTLGGKSAGTCPSRLGASSTDRELYCFAVGKDVTSKDGQQTISGQVSFNGNNGPDTADTLDAYIIDQGEWQSANAKTLSDFHVGAQNDDTRTDVAAPDSASASLYYNG